MKKRILSLLLCFVLCLTLIPKTKVFAEPLVNYDVWIGDEQFTSAKLTIDCGTGTATYDPTTGVLTLNNAQITGTGSGGGITSNEIITISLIGENTIDNFGDGIHVYVTGPSTSLDHLTLAGTGKLTMTNVLGGIRVNRGGLAITDSVTVEITSTKPSAPAAGLYVQSGALTIDSNSTVNITSAYTGAHVGYNVRIADNASVNITAANSGYGIESMMNDIEFLDNVIVTIKSSSHGVYTNPYGKVKFSGGTIDIESENKIAIKAKDGIIVDPKCEMLTPENGEIAAMTAGDYAGNTIVLIGDTPAKHVVITRKRALPSVNAYNEVIAETMSQIEALGKKIANGEDVEDATVYLTSGDALPLSILKTLKNCPGVTLDFRCTYQGEELHFVIEGGADLVINENIPWYGPLFLKSVYGVADDANAGEKKNSTKRYVIQRGDTLYRITKKLGISITEILRKNPQIKNPNRIRSGQVLKY